MSNEINKIQKDINERTVGMDKDLQEELIKLEKKAKKHYIQIVSTGLEAICRKSGVLRLNEIDKCMKRREINEYIIQHVDEFRNVVEKTRVPGWGIQMVEPNDDVVKRFVSKLEGIDDSIYCSDDLKNEIADMFNRIHACWIGYTIEKKCLLGEITDPYIEMLADPVKKVIIFKTWN